MQPDCASNEQSSGCNIDIVNLAYVRDIQMIKESRNAPKVQERIDTDEVIHLHMNIY